MTDGRSDPLTLALRRKERDAARHLAQKKTDKVMSPVWTPEEIATLTEMWLFGGNSAGEIAKKLGNGRTRNAVIGKAHRMNLPESKVPVGAAGQPKAAKKFKEAPKAHRTEATPGVEADARPVKSSAWEALPGYRPVRFADATGCNWPIGEDNGLCCNAPTGKRQVYCDMHKRASSYGARAA